MHITSLWNATAETSKKPPKQNSSKQHYEALAVRLSHSTKQAGNSRKTILDWSARIAKGWDATTNGATATTPTSNQTYERNHLRASEENLHHSIRSHRLSGDHRHANPLRITRSNHGGGPDRTLESILADTSGDGVETLHMRDLKPTRTVTYRRYGTPAVILEGKWLTDRYRLKIGDQIDVEFLPKEIRLRKSNRAAQKKKISPKGDDQQTNYINPPSGKSNNNYEQPSTTNSNESAAERNSEGNDR